MEMVSKISCPFLDCVFTNTNERCWDVLPAQPSFLVDFLAWNMVRVFSYSRYLLNMNQEVICLALEDYED